MTMVPRVTARPRTAVLLVPLAIAVGGCQRGCARRYAERLFAPGSGGELPRPGGDMPMTAACPEGLARCSGGHVFAASRLPPDTRCSPEGCACPWEDVGACAAGCVVDGLEVDVSRARARTQLCAPTTGTGTSFALPVPPGSHLAGQGANTAADAEATADIACEIEKYRCDRGIVFRCEGGAISIARCLQGCAEEGGTVLAPVTAEQASALLCLR